MKKVVLFLLFITGSYAANAQIPSNCNVPDVLHKYYDWEVKNMALKWIYSIQSPDTAFIDIPQWCQDTVWKGLAAIYNRYDQVEIDSIFNQYCIHGVGWGIVIWRHIVVYLDTTYSWTNNWSNLQTATGITALDSLLAKYEWIVTEYDSVNNFAILATTQSINEYILCDSLESFPGVLNAIQRSMGGQGGLSGIGFSDTGQVKYYTFHLAWGMANGHTWRYKIYPDCSIEFLGVVKGFYEPYPEPVNCNITGILHPAVPFYEVEIYPNPSSRLITISIPGISFPDHLTILNLNGQELITRQITEPTTTLDISSLPTGVYFVRVMSEKTVQVRKVLKE